MDDKSANLGDAGQPPSPKTGPLEPLGVTLPRIPSHTNSDNNHDNVVILRGVSVIHFAKEERHERTGPTNSSCHFTRP